VSLSLVQDQHEGGLVEDFGIAEETIVIVAEQERHQRIDKG
jgi:hypothetical protein